jgi:uncharacterized protein YecA (UPF0149 family)
VSYDRCSIGECTGVGVYKTWQGNWLCHEHAPPREPVRGEKIGNNDLCPCGTGKKFKKCCRQKLKAIGFYT